MNTDKCFINWQNFVQVRLHLKLAFMIRVRYETKETGQFVVKFKVKF